MDHQTVRAAVIEPFTLCYLFTHQLHLTVLNIFLSLWEYIHIVVDVLCIVENLFVILVKFLSLRPTLSEQLMVFLNPAPDVRAEVGRYSDVAKRIIELAVFGAAQNRSYKRLADFTDTIGNRVSGSQNLEMAIKYMYKALRQDGLDVHLGEF